MMLRQVAANSAFLPPPPEVAEVLPTALAAGFLPAFRHEGDGQVRLCLLEDGHLAGLHVLDSLPADWVAERDETGRPLVLVDQVSAGYLRGAEFWSIGDLRRPRLDG